MGINYTHGGNYMEVCLLDGLLLISNNTDVQ